MRNYRKKFKVGDFVLDLGITEDEKYKGEIGKVIKVSHKYTYIKWLKVNDPTDYFMVKKGGITEYEDDWLRGFKKISKDDAIMEML